MERNYLLALLEQNPPTPCFVVDEALLERNLEILDSVQQRTGARILLALKGFAMFSVFPLLRGTLHGVCASSPHEARLGREEFGREVHAFAAAYSEQDMRELVTLCDHISFNSFAQYARFRPMIDAAAHQIHCSIRINPEHSEGAVPLYDPCSPGSRLGVRRAQFDESAFDGIAGLHFHTLCEQNAAPLARTLDVVEKNFGHVLHKMEWLNMGGGHHITREDYDIDLLCECIDRVQQRYGVQVYLEPGEAVALNTGFLVSTVLDVIEADMPIAILDSSAAAHMPDVLEMPYRPHIIGSGKAREKAWTCRMGGHSCLAGDVMGEYSFDTPLAPGDRVVFTDMAIYSMVKTNTFNGLKLPSLAVCRNGKDLRVIREFGYDEYRRRLS